MCSRCERIYYIDSKWKCYYNHYMKKLKTKTFWFWVIGVFSLILGLLIYLLFRENTIITTQTSYIMDLRLIRNMFSWAESDFLKFYFVDFLWALSLSCGLHIIFKPKTKVSLICSVVVITLGTTFELLQFFNVINGTGDILDVICYILAALTVNVINFKRGS